MSIAASSGSESIPVSLTQRIHSRIAVLAADPAVYIPMPIIQARLVSFIRHPSFPLQYESYAALRMLMLCRIDALPPPRSSAIFQ
jgi:hypothetical protein